MKRWILGGVIVLTGWLSHGGEIENQRDLEDPFHQLGDWIPTPTDRRNAAGAPGSEYWQQKVDYRIEVELDDTRHHLHGREVITYHNQSPDSLRYLWLQLDNNIFDPHSDSATTAVAPNFDNLTYRDLDRLLHREAFDGSLKITEVADLEGRPLKHVRVKTMMRIDLPEPLPGGASTTFQMVWNYAITDFERYPARTGYEYFPKDDNYLYELAHWYPRAAVYTGARGWEQKAFLGRGEFALEFGDFEVAITVPDGMTVAATGVLQNPEAVLSFTQRERLARAHTAESPVMIITPEEAESNQSARPPGTKTWIFRAENVRDFAFAASRKFIWDAQGYTNGESAALAMSFYPPEALPLWKQYSTAVVLHTLEVYSRFTFDYPYPVAISVNGPVRGMEYPMICFNGPRPEEDGTYWDVPRGGRHWEHSKYGLISVIIHEVGHNFFPMIVNSDERQWTWMDEGLNTFLQYLAEQEWEEDYPSKRGEPRALVDYMKSTYQVPIMTSSDSILQFGNNAYAKPATALNILRETILGRELFDHAFREYARRWMFKRPEPADLFRTLEDASGIDLDWFWRGWFFTTLHCDIAIKNVRRLEVNTRDPVVENARQRREREQEPESLSQQRNRKLPKRVEQNPELRDFYNDYDPLEVTPKDRREYAELLQELEPWQEDLLKTDRKFYVAEFENLGGLVMPLILKIKFTEGEPEELRIPAEIWRRNSRAVSKLLVTTREIESIELDPHRETADTDLTNNLFPRRIGEDRFQLTRPKPEKNPMQEAADEASQIGESQSDLNESEDLEVKDGSR